MPRDPWLGRVREYDHFRRLLDSLRPPDDYAAIQVAWAQRRDLIAEFRALHPHLKPRVDGVQIFVDPGLGGRLDLCVRMPPGITKTALKSAMNEVHHWRECLSSFLSRSRVCVKGGVELARLTKHKNGKWRFWHVQPLLTSNDLNQRLEALVQDELWDEARELLCAFNVQRESRWIQRIHRHGLAKRTARNKITRIIGPFTSKLIEDTVKAWRKRQRVPTQSDPTKGM